MEKYGRKKARSEMSNMANVGTNFDYTSLKETLMSDDGTRH
jgi:hypothetical protein